MATNISPNECGVCNEGFNERERYPRILNCFHTLCTICVGYLIREGKQFCPFCREMFVGNSPNEVRVNHTALDFMRFLATQNLQSETGQKDNNIGQSSQEIKEIQGGLLELTVHNVALCQQSQKQTEKMLAGIIKMQNEFPNERQVIENGILPKLAEIIEKNYKTEEMLKQTSLKLQKQIQDMKIKERQLNTIKTRLEKNDTSEVKDLTKESTEAEVINIQFEKWFERFIEINTKAENDLNYSQKEMKRSKEKTERMITLLNSAHVSDEISQVGGLTIPEVQQYSELVTIESLRIMTASVERLVKEGKVYAVQTRLAVKRESIKREKMRRYARISLSKDNKLCLHSLKEEALPSSAHLLKHSDVLRLVDSSTPLTFIQLEDVPSETILGNVYIRLNPSTRRGENFFLLCTGVRGPSYANSKVLTVLDKDTDTEKVVFGDYEHNNGSGGRSLLKWTSSEGGSDYETPWLPGTVVGFYGKDETASQFLILTKKKCRSSASYSFGRVQGGLRVLTEAISKRLNSWDVSYSGKGNIHDIIVSDCGVVLQQIF